MSTRRIRKLTFDHFRDFNQPEPPADDAPPPPPTYSQADLEFARAEGVEEGRKTALAQGEASDAYRLASAADLIGNRIAALGVAETERSKAFRVAALDVAMAALRKTLPDLSRRFGQHEIEAVIGEVLAEQHEESRIVIRVPDSGLDALVERIDGIAAKHGYTGKTILVADAELGPSDLRVEWADGGVERIVERTLGDIAGAIARLAQFAETDTPTV